MCAQPAEAGSCEAWTERFFHNATSGKCEAFRYGGCAGNGNNFGSVEACEERCAQAEVVTSDACMLERDPGPCTDPMSQWYFDARAGDCRLFTYGGCRGNANRFPDKDACRAACLGRRLAALTDDADAVDLAEAPSSSALPPESRDFSLTVRVDKTEWAAGEKVILTCHSDKAAVTGFSWLKDGAPLRINARKNRIQVNLPFSFEA